METKECFKCGETKPLTDFYKHPSMKDGRVNKCKGCNKKDVVLNRLNKVDHYRSYDKRRNKTPERKTAFANKQRAMRSRNPSMMAAHNAVARAIKSGELSRPDKCSRCESREMIQAHHDDHTKVLDIMWLCPVCHAQRHIEIGKVKVMDD